MCGKRSMILNDKIKRNSKMKRSRICIYTYMRSLYQKRTSDKTRLILLPGLYGACVVLNKRLVYLENNLPFVYNSGYLGIRIPSLCLERKGRGNSLKVFCTHCTKQIKTKGFSICLSVSICVTE